MRDALEAVSSPAFQRQGSSFDQNHEVVPRRPARSKALTRDAALAMQRVVDRNSLVVGYYDYYRVRLLRAPYGLQTDVCDGVPVALNEVAQFVIAERLLGRAYEAEPARGIDRPHRLGPEQGATVAQLAQALFCQIEAEPGEHHPEARGHARVSCLLLMKGGLRSAHGAARRGGGRAPSSPRRACA